MSVSFRASHFQPAARTITKWQTRLGCPSTPLSTPTPERPRPATARPDGSEQITNEAPAKRGRAGIRRRAAAFVPLPSAAIDWHAMSSHDVDCRRRPHLPDSHFSVCAMPHGNIRLRHTYCRRMNTAVLLDASRDFRFHSSSRSSRSRRPARRAYGFIGRMAPARRRSGHDTDLSGLRRLSVGGHASALSAMIESVSA
jgi:hypothetical protein